MNQEYSLASDLAPPAFNMDQFVQNVIVPNYKIVAAVIVVLVLVILYLMMNKEKYMPTTLLRQQSLDYGLASKFEDGKKCGNGQYQVEGAAYDWVADQLKKPDPVQQATTPSKQQFSDNRLSAVMNGLR